MINSFVLDHGSALAVADFASYRRPDCRVIFVTNTSFFSDGSIFRHCANACAYLQSQTEPADLAASERAGGILSLLSVRVFDSEQVLKG